MKKILNILLGLLIVHRAEIKNKWWHRLFVVLLLGSSIAVLVSYVVIAVVSFNHAWVSYRPIAFSLEPNYQQAKGKEFSCRNDLHAYKISMTEPNINGWGIVCDGVTLSEFDSKRYAKLWSSARQDLENQFGLDKYKYIECPSVHGGYIPVINRLHCGASFLLDEKLADPAYPAFEVAEKNLAHIKVTRDINFGLMLTDIVLWLIIPLAVLLLWVIFWSSVIYRAVLYVVFGKNK